MRLIAPTIIVSAHNEADISTRYMESFKIWDSPVTELLLHIVTPLEKSRVTFIDIGSYNGYYSSFVAIQGVNVYSFDAFSLNSQKTCETALLNHVGNRISVYNFLLSSESKYERWCAPLDNLAFSIWNGCPEDNDVYFDHYVTEQVRLVSGDEWIEEHLGPELLDSRYGNDFIVRIAVSGGFEEAILKNWDFLTKR